MIRSIDELKRLFNKWFSQTSILGHRDTIMQKPDDGDLIVYSSDSMKWAPGTGDYIKNPSQGSGSTDESVVRMDGESGQLIQDTGSNFTATDAGDVTIRGPGGLLVVFGSVFANNGEMTALTMKAQQGQFNEITNRVATGAPSFVLGLKSDTVDETNTDAGVTIDGMLVKDGYAEPHTVWKGTWAPGTYEKNWQAIDNGWLGIANKQTTDPLAPQESGDANWSLPEAPSWLAQNTTSAPSYTGVQFTVTEAARFVSMRAWIPEVASPNLSYRLWATNITNPTNPIVLGSVDLTTIADSVGWLEFGLTGSIILPGVKIEVVLEAIKTVGTDTQWSHTWQYDGTSGGGDPGANKYTRTASHTALHISTTDEGGTNRAADLALVKIGDEIECREDTTRYDLYAVTSVTDNGTWYEFGVTRIENGLTVRTNDVTITATIKPAADNTSYVQLTDYWLTNAPPEAGVKGFSVTDPSDIGTSLDDNAYGVDVRGVFMDLSPDWDIQAAPPSSIALTAEILSGLGTTSTGPTTVDPDYLLSVAMGLVPGASLVQKYGRNTDVDSGSTPEHIWSRGGQWVPPTQDRIHDIASSSAQDAAGGTGARQIDIEGLSGGLLQSEVVTLTGTTPTPTANAYGIIFRKQVVDGQTGSAGTNVGDITSTAQVDGTVTAEIPAGKGQTLMAIYTIPDTHKGYLISWYASMNRSNQSGSADLELIAVKDGTEKVKGNIGLNNQGDSRVKHEYDAVQEYDGGTTFIVNCEDVSANNTDITAGFDILLIEQ